MNYVCVICKNAILKTGECCGINYEIKKDQIEVSYDKLLYKNFRRDYMLNKTLNNNGHLSYLYLPAGSISLSDRKDVKSFGEYIRSNCKLGKLIDIGCGTMEIPGYLQSLSKDNRIMLYGLDPIRDIAFKGKKVISCAEYIPFSNGYFDTIVFATSIDHVCSLSATIKESHRILSENGKMILWHFYPMGFSLRKEFLRKLRITLKSGYNAFRYCLYPEHNVVFNIPKGAIDPFHKEYISHRKLRSIAKENGFQMSDSTSYDGNSYFTTFTKL